MAAPRTLCMLVFSICSSIVCGFMSSPQLLAVNRLAFRQPVPVAARTSQALAAAAAGEHSFTPAAASAQLQRRSTQAANGGFSSVARSESAGLLEELGRREVFGGPPPGGPSNRNPDFEPNLGKVIDTLRADYPVLFYEPLDYSIYTKDIVVKDPTGVVFKGLGTYRRLFAALRFFRSTLMDNVETRFRVVYDWANQRVRVNWHTTIIFKARRQHPVFVDAISVYKINDDGFVSAHNFETIIVNGTPVEPPFAYAWINLEPFLAGKERTTGGMAVPHGSYTGTAFAGAAGSSSRAAEAETPAAVTSMAAAAAAQAPAQQPQAVDLVGSLSSSGMSAAVAQTAERSSSSSSSTSKGSPTLKKAGKSPARAALAWPKIDLPSGCEDSWDCESPMTCCDFAVFKMCCHQGMGTPVVEPKLVPIPIPVEDYPRYPDRW